MKVIYIDTEEIYQYFLKSSYNKNIIIHYTTKDFYNHSANNEICLLACFIQDLDELYILLLNHNEVLYNVTKTSAINKIIDAVNNVYVFDKKEFLHLIDLYNDEKIIDINLLYYLEHNESIDSNKINIDYTLYRDFIDVGTFISSTKLIENCQFYINEIEKQIKVLNLEGILGTEYNFYNNNVIPNLCEIEKNGLYVDVNKFNSHFKEKNTLISEKNIVYSNYNLYTSTGRPSNNYGGINFAALEKKDGSRESFISRFDNGYLLEFDFDGYHLKLIAKLIGYEIPTDLSIHEYLGRYYFDTKDVPLTSEQYKESKEISFKIIYGGHSKDFQEIPYFKYVYEYIEKIWDELKINNYIISPISKKKIKKGIEKTNKNKFFNYLIQLLETEYSMIVIQDLLQLIKVHKLKSKLILYTYDSFLFDCNSEDINLITLLKTLLQKYDISYKLKSGKNYRNLKIIS